MAPHGRTVEQELARIASSQHGVVTRTQLLRAGISHDEVKHRLCIGTLLREYRGVYRVGHRAPSVEARFLAAARACGDGALLSGRAADHLIGLHKPPCRRTACRLPLAPAPTDRRARRLPVPPLPPRMGAGPPP